MEKIINTLIFVYYLMMNGLGFILMEIDKKKARKQEWRISERTLLLTAFLGGGLGSLMGMRFFHHKTRHVKFQILIPISIFVNVLLIYCFYHYID